MIRFAWMRGPLREQAGADGADGGGGGNPPAFDPAAFQTALMDQVNKTINAVVKNLKKELAPKEPEPKQEQEPEPKPEDKAKPDFRIKQLEQMVTRLKEENDTEKRKREETEQRSKAEKLKVTLREELAKAGVDQKKISAAERIFGPDVRYSEDGEIIAGSDDAPLAAYLESVIGDYEYLLPPKQTGGAGAGPGGKRGVAIDIGDIKPGMTKEQEAAALAEIRRALGK